jgi:hypothetical protein
LDVKSLGFNCPLEAATPLLWDVLRLVNKDSENPTVAIEDAVAIVPRPGFMGTWPSLYKAFRDAVLSSGSVDLSEPKHVSKLLLSQLKPILQNRWHANFDENGMGFLNDEGGHVKMKKMKHLVQAVLRWRDQRVEWQQSVGAKMTEIDDLLCPRLELVQSKTHNDLLLQCEMMSSATQNTVDGATVVELDSVGSSMAPQKFASVEQELIFLRAENKKLRQEQEDARVSESASQEKIADPRGELISGDLQLPRIMSEVFDDPYEPPPQRDYWSATPAVHSLADWSEISTTCSTPETPRSGLQESNPNCMKSAACAFVPMWFISSPAMLGDRSNIPSGIVQRHCMQIEAVTGPNAAEQLTAALQPHRGW